MQTDESPPIIFRDPMRKKLALKDGFTLVEMLIVVAITL